MPRTLTEQDLRLIRLVEQRTGAVIKDCIISEDTVALIVLDGVEKAIGQQGRNVRELERILKKRVRLIQWNDEMEQFVKNAFAPGEIASIKEKEGVLILEAPTYQARGLLIGRSAQTLRTNEAILKRYFPIQQVRVL